MIAPCSKKHEKSEAEILQQAKAFRKICDQLEQDLQEIDQESRSRIQEIDLKPRDPGVSLEDHLKDAVATFDQLDRDLRIIEIESSGHAYKRLRCVKCGYEWIAQLRCRDKTCRHCRRIWYGYHYKTLRNLFRTWVKNGVCYKMELTLKNIPQDQLTRKKLSYIRSCFRKLLRRSTDPKKKHSPKFKDLIKGGFYFVQMTNKGRGWHLHLHVVYKGAWIPHSLISSVWRDITGDSFVVWHRRIKNAEKACQYLLGDLLKATQIRPCDKAQYNSVMYRSRIVQAFGDYARVKFKQPFRCPRCNNDTWIDPDLEMRRFAREREQGVLWDDTS